MPPIRDVMPAFELFQPASVTDALGILDRHGADAWVMAGGMDTFDWLKDRIKKPRVVVDLGMVNELRGIKDAGGGLEIGATTTLTTIANNPLVKERFPLLAQAALIVASPQIRNQGTLGGNVSQDARCWYYRAGWPCYRAGGNICYADTPQAINREHAIFNADRCVAVNPSDTAPALDRARRAVRDQARLERARRAGRGVLHRPGNRHHPADDPAARRSAHRDPPAGDVGGQGPLLREGPRPHGVGLRARQHCRGDQRLGVDDQRRAHGGEWRGGHAVPPDRGRDRSSGARRATRPRPTRPPTSPCRAP